MKIALVVSTIAAAFALIIAGQVRDRLHTLPPARVEIPAAGIALAMQDAGGRPVVDVRINGKGPYRFILDTAANASVIDTDLNRELALGSQRFVHIDDLHLGDGLLSDVFAAVLPLRSLFPGDDGPRCVLSASIFPEYLVTFDYPRKRILIRRGALGDSDLQYTAEDTLPTVPVRIAGHTVRVRLDTGARIGLSVPTRYMAELPLAASPVEAGRNRTLAGDFPASRAKIEGAIEIGNFKLDLDYVEFTDAHGGTGAVVGRLGYDALHRFVVTLDSKNRRIRFEE